MITILCYPRCGTCRKAENWLKEQGIEYNYRPIVEENPNFDELKEWFLDSGLPRNRWFNTSGKLYRENKIKDIIKIATPEELLEILASDGMFIKRPILLHPNKIVTGFKQEEWEEICGK